MFYKKENIELLKKALALIAEEDAALLPSAKESAAVSFSDGFNRKMEKLIKFQKKPYYHILNTVGKRVACIVTAVFLAISCVTFSVKALRNTVVEFFVETFEKFSIIGVKDGAVENNLTKIKTYYVPTYLPLGFELSEEIKTGNLQSLEYFSGEKRVSFSQQIVGDGEYYIDTEGAETKEVFINDGKGYLSKKEDVTVLYWNDDFYVFAITAIGLEESEVIKIAKMIKAE